MELEFEVKRETKGAILYKQVKDGRDFTIPDGAEVGEFYMRKSAFPDGAVPKKLRLTINF